jgi:putative CocE/NonD family hydrolase
MILSRDLKALLERGPLPPAKHGVADIHCQTATVAMRDGTGLATDIYLPPQLPAPVVVMRTPYLRDREDNGAVGALIAFARRGYALVAQDCRGTGGSEPNSWDYYMYESEDGVDCVEWITQQPWYGGFIGSFGGSYVGQTQWCMAQHPAMSTIVPSVSGLGFASNTARLYMFINSYARVIGNGPDKVAVAVQDMERHFEKDTLSGGYFNEPLQPGLSPRLHEIYPELMQIPLAKRQRWLWERYCALSSAKRAQFVHEALGTNTVTSSDVESLSTIFGQRISHDAHTIPHADPAQLCKLIQAPPMMITGWYDWCLGDALATWSTFRREAQPEVASRARLIIGPHAHNMPGYREGSDKHPDLLRLPNIWTHFGLISAWYDAVREQRTQDWPTVLYYLMGANEWHAAPDWPVPGAQKRAFYLHDHGMLSEHEPTGDTLPDRYRYDPNNPTPTVGGSIVSFLYTPGSVDVGAVQKRPDVLIYTTPPLEKYLDVVGPLTMVLYASSSARDTDFVARLSDVFPDGRAIQIQSGILRARYRNAEGDPELLVPGRLYRFEIDLWATANRFEAGHRIRVDISSADFPHFDRNSNLGGEAGEPVVAEQSVYHDMTHASHLLVWVLESQNPNARL